LIEIAHVLDVRANWFIANPTAAGPVGRRALTKNNEGFLQHTSRVDYEVLYDDLAHRHNIFWKVRILCRSLEEFGEFLSYPGEEFLLVLEEK
jgi:hypothetical protein